MHLSGQLKENMDALDRYFKDCADILKREMTLVEGTSRDAVLYYAETAADNMTLSDSVIGRMIAHLWDVPASEQAAYLKNNALGVTDAKLLTTVQEAVDGVLAGDVILMINGMDAAVKIKAAGFPSMGVSQAVNETVIRGSNEGFAESVKSSTALVRKRIRNTDLKVLESTVGKQTKTTVALLYMESLVRPEVLREVQERLQELSQGGETEATRVGVLDSGVIEQLTERFPLSPFPQYQTTERPDRAAIALLQGKLLILSDNSPVGLLLPANFTSFFHTSDDYYSRTAVVALERLLRFFAAFLAVGLPGLYLSVITYHQEILPTAFLFRLAEARAAIPVPALVEVLMMELAFELLREAGVRVPGAMGNAIGIVGGLIVGDGAVSAGLVSPIIVIVVALTALASFAIPNEEMASAFRVLKYVLILLSAIFGLYGWSLGMFLILVHLAKLESYHFPYLYPIVSGELNDDADQKDMWIRFPLRKLRRKSFYAEDRR